MTDPPTCNKCESTRVHWGTTPNGKWALYDNEPILHFRTCTKRPKAKAKAKKPQYPDYYYVVLTTLQGPEFGRSKAQATAILEKAQGHDEQSLFLDCLRVINEWRKGGS